MFDKRLLESSELYDKRYKNFATLTIIPILLIFLGLFVFSVFAKKELLVTSTGDIEPTRIISQVQSSSNQVIILNHLKEGESVKKGEVLLSYNQDSNQTQLSTLKTQLAKLNDQKSQLVILQNSYLKNQNLFKKSDAYGYEQTFEDYQEQKSTLSDGVQKSNQTVDQQNQTVGSEQSTINTQIDTLNSEIASYQELVNALTSNTAISASNPYLNQYNSYIDQINALQNAANTTNQATAAATQAAFTKNESQADKDKANNTSLANQKATQATADSQKNSLKSQFLTSLQASVESLKSQVQSLNLQASSLTKSDAYDKSLNSQLLSLKAQSLASANKNMSDLNDEMTQLQAKIALQEQTNQQSEVKADSAGILHVLPNVEGLKNIAAGSPIAEIYPNLSQNVKIELAAYIPSSQISAVKIGQKLRFTVQQNLPKAEILSGKITKIDSAPTETKSGLNVYKVQATTTLKQTDLTKIRYGLQGKVTIVIGDKTFFNYYKDKVMGKD